MQNTEMYQQATELVSKYEYVSDALPDFVSLLQKRPDLMLESKMDFLRSVANDLDKYELAYEGGFGDIGDDERIHDLYWQAFQLLREHDGDVVEALPHFTALLENRPDLTTAMHEEFLEFVLMDIIDDEIKQEEKELARFVRNAGIDWAEFHRQLNKARGKIIKEHCDYSQSRRILTSMGCSNTVIDKVVEYFDTNGCSGDEEIGDLDMNNPEDWAF
jgi:hypothetical protein